MANVTPGIVAACDGSEHSSKAAKMAAELAHATGRPLRLLTVFPHTKLERMIVRGTWSSDLDQEEQDYGRKVFDTARQAIGSDANIEEEILLQGEPAHKIIEYLEANPGTHLVLGRRGHSAVERLTLGSISEKVVRHATGPVTVVSD
ncbi:universal stress protein [Marinobacter santoriniensis]|nr:universal stress protein [Marinobacter santoriniensis]